MSGLPQPRRWLLSKVTELFDSDEAAELPSDRPPRLTPHVLEALRMSRSRDRVLDNLDEMYREAFQRADATQDDAQKVALDFAYRREQLYFEILLDIRDAMEKMSR
ncbi:MAG: hypothetical protein MUE41_10635 [Gemmatimonadaceae bacterium]|jgi:hypothetical protein|nr:hypothetical protein [Gemmatimonadaceae bacterium]